MGGTVLTKATLGLAVLIVVEFLAMGFIRQARRSGQAIELTPSLGTETKLRHEVYDLEDLISRYELYLTVAQKPFSDEVVAQAREVGKAVRQSVVLLSGKGPLGAGAGTAWFIEPGILITNGHNVIESGLTSFTATTLNGESFTAEAVSWTQDDGDIAILKTDYTKLPGLPLGSSQGLKLGDPIVQVGHPSAIGSWAISLGPVAKLGERNQWLLSLVPTASGSSGSPIFSLDGKVVGMTSGGAPTSGVRQIKSETVYQAFEQIEFTTSDSIELIQDKLEQARPKL